MYVVLVCLLKVTVYLVLALRVASSGYRGRRQQTLFMLLCIQAPHQFIFANPEVKISWMGAEEYGQHYYVSSHVTTAVIMTKSFIDYRISKDTRIKCLGSPGEAYPSPPSLPQALSQYIDFTTIPSTDNSDYHRTLSKHLGKVPCVGRE